MVWELYAKIPERLEGLQREEEEKEGGGRGVDLVGFVKGMSEHLLPVDAVCKSLSALAALLTS